MSRGKDTSKSMTKEEISQSGARPRELDGAQGGEVGAMG